MMMRRFVAVVALLAAGVLGAGCGGGDGSADLEATIVAMQEAPPATVMVVVTATPDLQATIAALRGGGAATAVSVPADTPVPAPTGTPAPTAIPVPTPTPTLVPTATPVPVATPVPAATPTATPVPTPTAVPAPEYMSSPTPVATPRPGAVSGRWSIPELKAAVDRYIVDVTTPGGFAGTGFFIKNPDDPDRWYVVTNAHVVEGNAWVSLGWADDLNSVEADVLGADEEADVALLDAQPSDFAADWERRIEAGAGIGYRHTGENLTGEEIIIVGYSGVVSSPEVRGTTVTHGIISHGKVGGACGYPNYDVYWLQTDGAMNPGDSGGPMVTLGGVIVGMNTCGDINLDSVNYALDLNEVWERWDVLTAGGR